VIFQHAVLAVLLVGAAAVLALAAAVPHAVAVLRHWDTASGSARQLRLERRTTLVSAVVAVMLVAQAAALLLFVFNADRMATMFVGAMCAVGTLQVNRWGFPALWAQIASLFAAGMWLTLNAVDVRSPHYPLTRAKHGLLLAVVPLSLVSFALQAAYFSGLKADVITSCCGSLFSGAPSAVASELAGAYTAWSPSVAVPAFFAVIAAAATLSFVVAWRGRGGALLGLCGVIGLVASLLAIVAFVAPYVYEDPRHHCPFCILKAEYSYRGYLLYVPLFGATAAALGALALAPFADRPLLAKSVARATGALARVSGTLWILFAWVVCWIIADSRLVLIGNAAR
jgi:hypothetical protein